MPSVSGEQRAPSLQHGRRSSDYWGRFGKGIAIAATVIALIASFGKVWDAGAQVGTNKAGVAELAKRVARIEIIQTDGHYMTCVMFQDIRPEAVPASCDLALRRRQQ